MDNKVIIIAGPTASGKTSLGIELAKALGGEIVCADSMQVYRDMPIATAAPTQWEREQVPHHLAEFLDIGESFSVAVWCRLAKECINDILSREKVPIIVGGTGLFIDSLADNIKFDDAEIDFELRRKLMSKDIDELYDELVRLDPSSAAEIHENNKKRVVRALEIYYSGITKTQMNINSRREKSPYDFLYFVLEYNDRQKLYDRINKRVDIMVQNGLVDEAKKCLGKNTSTSAQAIGHKELVPYFASQITLEEALDNLKKETRHYAKRQITWFKRRENAVHIPLDKEGENALCTLIKLSEDFLNGKTANAKSE